MTKSEPTFTIYSVLTALTAIQWPVIHMSNTLHIIVTAVLGLVAAIVNRSRVTPY